MSAKRDYYDVLGVSRGVDGAAIKRAYRKLAKKYHPDSNSGSAQAEENFKEITEAYNVLSDDKKRKLYDQFGHAAFEEGGFQEGYGQGGFGPGGFGQGGFRQGNFRQGGFDGGSGSAGRKGGTYRRSYGPDGSYQEFHFEGAGDMDDFLRSVFGDGAWDDSFQNDGSRRGAYGGSGFGNEGFGTGYESGGRKYRGRDTGGFGGRGRDLHADIELTFEEAVLGAQKRIQLRDAEGREQTLEIKIPAGIESGKSIRLKGKGMPGSAGAQPGDLFLKASVKEKPGYRREGLDIYTTVRIPFTTAVFGGEVRIQTVYGDVLCKIKEGLQPGTKMRLKGKGVVSMNNPSVRGDQYAVIEIQAPRNMGPEARQKLKEYEQALGREQRRSTGAA